MPADTSPDLVRDQGGAPWTVVAAAVLALLEAVGASVFVVRFLLEVLPLEEPRLMQAGFALGVVALVGGAAVALVLAARALVALRYWPRSVLVVAQVMALAIGIPMAQAGDWVGWLIVAMGVVGLALLLHPATTAALERAS